MTKNTRFSPEVRQRAIRMVLESQGEYDSQWAGENRELRRSNDILRQASAYFAKAEFDRLWKK